ncbi:Sulfhydrogenase subunit alpha, partial [hydrothermal vent metagenome]
LRRSLESFGLQRNEADLRLHAEKVIRNYDPCISCATHFLQLDVEYLSRATESERDTNSSCRRMPVSRTPDAMDAGLCRHDGGWMNQCSTGSVRVIGIGSPFGADRLGWEVVQQLEQDTELQKYPPEKLALCTLDRPGTGLLEFLKDNERVILIDALAVGNETASRREQVIELKMEDLAGSNFNLSSHAIGIREALALYRAMENIPDSKPSPDIVVFGLDVGDDIDTPFNQQSIVELSRVVKKRLLEFILQEHTSSGSA